MPSIQKIFQALSRPAGLPSNRQNTPEEIKKWKEEVKPNFIQSSSYLKLGSIGTVILALITGAWALMKDSSIGKWISGIGGGVALGGLGLATLGGGEFDFMDAGIHAAHDLGIIEEDERRRRRQQEEELQAAYTTTYRSPPIYGIPRSPSDPYYALDPNGEQPWLQ